MTTSTSATGTSRGTARQAASSLADGAGAVAAITAGAIAAYATHRLAPARVAGHGRLLAAGATGLVTAVLLDGIARDACAPLRARYRTTGHVASPVRPMAPLQSLEDALAHLAVDAARDAAHRAPADAYLLDTGKSGLLRDERRWRGYPDGTASCFLAPGITLLYTRHETTYGSRPEYTLLTADSDQPVAITRLAQLRLHLDAHAAGLPVARTPSEDDGDQE